VRFQARQFMQRFQSRRLNMSAMRTSEAAPQRSPLVSQAIATLKTMTVAGATNGSFLVNAYKLVKEFRKSNQQRGGEAREQWQRWQGRENKAL
jgi:hypothetical protein